MNIQIFQHQIQWQDAQLNELDKRLQELEKLVNENACKPNSIIIAQLVYTFADLMAEAMIIKTLKSSKKNLEYHRFQKLNKLFVQQIRDLKNTLITIRKLQQKLNL